MGPVDAVGATHHEGSVFSGWGLPMRAARAAKADLAGRSWCTQDSRGLGREVTSSRGGTGLVRDCWGVTSAGRRGKSWPYRCPRPREREASLRRTVLSRQECRTSFLLLLQLMCQHQRPWRVGEKEPTHGGSRVRGKREAAGCGRPREETRFDFQSCLKFG